MVKKRRIKYRRGNTIITYKRTPRKVLKHPRLSAGRTIKVRPLRDKYGQFRGTKRSR